MELTSFVVTGVMNQGLLYLVKAITGEYKVAIL